jgi:pyruvate/2-oxoglutarate dehydrogenase complex dihydrolipoamide dehydrogenase (E3) component
MAAIANLYLAGDWIGPTGFLTDASMASARQVAHLLLKDGSRALVRSGRKVPLMV